VIARLRTGCRRVGWLAVHPATLAALGTTLLLVAAAGAAQARADAPEPPAEGLLDRGEAPPTGSRPTGLLGDWLGLRTALARLGVAPTITWTTDVLGNPVGGQRQALREFDDLSVQVDVDLDRLLGAPGTSFNVGLSQRSGTNLSGRDIGNVFNVAQACCGATFRLVDAFLEQPLFGGFLNLRGGRLVAGDEFLSSPLYSLFVQSGINGNPAGILLDAPGMTSHPTATWGLRARLEPDPRLYAMLGVFNGDPTLGQNDKHGADWSMRGPVFAIIEIGYRLNQDGGNSGRPGNYKIGGYYDGGTYPDFVRDIAGGSAPITRLPPRTTRGKTGFYVLADQMIYRESGTDRHGLTPFVAFVGAPDESTNQMPFFLNGGVVYRGLIPRRDDDVAALSVVYGRFSRDLQQAERLQHQAGVGIQDYEVALEWTYVFQIVRGLTAQPDIQYIIRPGGTGAITDALVLGFQLSVTF
jgi:porin